ncbi:MAG: carbon-nitrogen hydrolase [Flaviaesturariibacter sp.]|nr:carbon-nitrogen hydrolase [Flaviaesturariibacter sp.]
MQVEVRHLMLTDYEELKASMIESYKGWDTVWKESQIQKLVSLFPDGQLAITVDEKVVGCSLSIIVDYKNFGDDHTYQQVTGNYSFTTHTPKGDFLYGIDSFISPEYRGLRLGRRMYDARKELCEKLNLKGIVFGGRIPDYHKHAAELSPKEYIQKVKSKEIHDPTLNFQLSNDFHVKKILKNYMPGDLESADNAVLLQWNNIYYTDPKKAHYASKSRVRLGLVQWQMRNYRGLEELFNQMEFFVDATSGYKADFALFPEFFNAPLLMEYNHLPEPEAIRELAKHTEAIRKKFSEFAVSYNINIITGSMPLIRENGELNNIGYLIRRDGSYEVYEKIHITPDEAKFWGLVGGNKVETFDTDCGRIGVLVCYDVEFPELGRILAEQGMQILFVPFLTDTQNAYSRVRNCAMARAIENECFVAIAGSVGNLPKVSNMDIQFAQSAVFTPCDFSFPTNGIKGESTPNTEMVLVVDVDLDLLKELNSFGSVRNLKDRRTDLYHVSLKR